MATITSVRTGDWFNPSTWDSNSIPTSVDDVILNHPVRANSNIIVGSIINLNTGGGELIISTNLTITCTGTGILGNKVLLISPKTINSPLIQNVGGVMLDSPLLDLYPGAAAAYSLRKLRIGYTGGVIRVRRSSDNSEQDIGFDELNNLDTSSLLSFCAGTNGFVTTWYDQSGNNANSNQSSASSQPQIVNSGNLITTNGKPSLLLDGVNDDFYTTVGAYTVTDFYFVISTIDTTYLYPFKETLTYGFVATAGSTSNSSQNYGNPSLYTNGVFRNSSNRNLVYIAQYGYNLVVHQNANTSSWTGGYQFFNYGGGFSFNGNVQEIIIYPSSQSSNRIGIQGNINSYYNIY